MNLKRKSQMEKKIKSVEKGWGEGSMFFSTLSTAIPYKVDEIKEETKEISSDKKISVLRGYKKGNLYFEMGITSDVVILYYLD